MVKNNNKCYICGKSIVGNGYENMCHECYNKYIYYKCTIVDKDNWLINKKPIDLEEILTYKQTYEQVLKKCNKLESRRKYKIGNEITSVDEMIKQDILYVNGKIWNSACFGNLQLNTILKFRINYAIKKENKI